MRCGGWKKLTRKRNQMPWNLSQIFTSGRNIQFRTKTEYLGKGRIELKVAIKEHLPAVLSSRQRVAPHSKGDQGQGEFPWLPSFATLTGPDSFYFHLLRSYKQFFVKKNLENEGQVKNTKLFCNYLLFNMTILQCTMSKSVHDEMRKGFASLQPWSPWSTSHRRQQSAEAANLLWNLFREAHRRHQTDANSLF